MAQARRCMCCMSEVPQGSSECPECGFNGSQHNPDGYLPIGTRLDRGKFLVGGVKKVWMECTDYYGFDIKGNRICTVREYLPAGGTERKSGETAVRPLEGAEKRFRDGLEKFASSFGRINSMPAGISLLRQYACLLQNGTAYVVMETFDGITLKELIRMNGGTLTQGQTGTVMKPVIDAVAYMHSCGVVHGNITPDTILIGRDGDVRLVGFATGDEPGAQKPLGYLSPEAEKNRTLSSASDVYGLAAVYYRAIVGTVPQDAVQRLKFDTMLPPDEENEYVSAEVSSAVWHGMILNENERISRAEDFELALEGKYHDAEETAVIDIGTEKARTAPEEMPEEEPETASSGRGMRLWVLLACLSVSLLAVMALVYYFSGVISQKESQLKFVQSVDSGKQNLIEVPEYTGQNIENIKFNTLSFDYLIVNTYAEGAEDGEVLNQDPQPGTGLGTSDRRITLYVNRTSLHKITMTDLTNLYLPNAEEYLTQQGIQYRIEYRETKTGQSDLVIDQSVREGETLDLSDELIIYVSKRSQKGESTDESDGTA